MHLPRPAITAMTYGFFGAAGYIAWSYLPTISHVSAGKLFAAVGFWAGVLNALFWASIDEPVKHLNSTVLTSEMSRQLAKKLRMRARFLLRRWASSLCIFAIVGLAGYFYSEQTQPPKIGPVLEKCLAALTAATIPAFITLIKAKLDSLGLTTQIAEVERIAKDRAAALNELRKE